MTDVSLVKTPRVGWIKRMTNQASSRRRLAVMCSPASMRFAGIDE